ncbi:MAG: hypothetical protein ABSE93_03475 [Terriglobia bacterium]|jgi:hypothetical protein
MREGKWVALIEAGLDDPSRQSLANLNRFRDAASFGDRAGHIGARCHVAAFLERFNAQPDRNSVHRRDPFLTLSLWYGLAPKRRFQF